MAFATLADGLRFLQRTPMDAQLNVKLSSCIAFADNGSTTSTA